MHTATTFEAAAGSRSRQSLGRATQSIAQLEQNPGAVEISDPKVAAVASIDVQLSPVVIHGDDFVERDGGATGVVSAEQEMERAEL